MLVQNFLKGIAMKSLISLFVFFGFFVLFFGCQTDTPVQADETNVTLEKPDPFYQLELVEATTGSPRRVVGIWGSYGGAKSWKAVYTDGSYWYQIGTYEAVKGQSVLMFEVDVTGFPSGIYNFQIQAFDGKGNMMGYWVKPVSI